MTAARQTLEGYVYELIDARSEADTPAETYRDLLGLFMEFSDEKGASLSRSELKDSALNLIIAGRSALVETTFIKIWRVSYEPNLFHDTQILLGFQYRDTTAQALSWTFFHLIKQPHLIAPLRLEIGDRLSEDELVNYDNYKQFVNVLAVFHEALRLHPSVPKVRKWPPLREEHLQAW